VSSTVEVLVLDLLEWVARADRSYDETMEAWRTSCPRLPVWEEATDRGLVTIELVDNLPRVRVTPVGLEWLTRCRPQQSDQVVKPAVLDSRTSRR
jgi:D-3-phosphoglycerate dehydrogenase